MRPTVSRVLILGGARSGKSAYAERLANQWAVRRQAERVYIATAEALDEEMATRIARHRAERGAGWRTVEAPRELPAALADEATPGRVVLVDCLTLWLSNEMLADDAPAAGAAARGAAARGAATAEDRLGRRFDAFIEAFSAAPGLVIAVSNEVGFGLAPTTPLGRAFRDAQGRLNQRVAAAADYAALVAAGLPLALKGEAPG